MEDQEQEHHHYWPGEGCIPITPQASRYGYVFPVHVTRSVWSNAITWTPQRNRKDTAESRIYDLCHACYEGMGKALAAEPDRVYFEFKHWFWDRLKPKAKKKVKAKYGARLLLDPETEEPWLLIFDPSADGKEVLKHGEPETDRGTDEHSEGMGLGDGAPVDQSNPFATFDPDSGACDGATEGS